MQHAHAQLYIRVNVYSLSSLLLNFFSVRWFGAYLRDNTMWCVDKRQCFHFMESFFAFRFDLGYNSPSMIRCALIRFGDTLHLNCFLVQHYIQMGCRLLCALRLRQTCVRVYTLFLVSHNKCSWPTVLSFSSRSNTEPEARQSKCIPFSIQVFDLNNK